MINGEERPIVYASRTITKTEQKYAQIDKEALTIVWEIKKIFHYLYARRFTLITDHKPLAQILHPEKSLPVLCISHMANYADYLSHFNYDVLFKTTKANKNADYCSRAPLPITSDSINMIHQGVEEILEVDEFKQFILNQVKQLPIRADHIARETKKDANLGKIVHLLESGQNLTVTDIKLPNQVTV